MLPSTYINLDSREKAFIIAAIDKKVEEEKKKAKQIKPSKKGR